MMQLEPWRDLSDLSGVAALLDGDADALRAEDEAFPDGVYGIAAVEDGQTHGAAISVERDGWVNLVRLAADSAAGEALLGWAEARTTELGATGCRVTVKRAPPLPFDARGYRLCERYFTMRSQGRPGAPGPLPSGVEETHLAQVGVDRFLAASNLSFAEVPGAFPLTSDDWDAIRREAGYREDLVRVLVDTGEVVGFLRGVLQPTPTVEAIGLIPTARGRGLGRWLLRRCEDLLTHAGAEVRELYVAESNMGAVTLYRSEGWQVHATRETWERQARSLV